MGNEGTYRVDGNSWTLRFERELKHPVAQVWEHLTGNDWLKGWLSDDGSIDLRPGGAVKLNDQKIFSTIVDLDPPRVIEFGWKGEDWDGGTVRWELTPSPEGTHLVLIHRMKALSPAEAEEFKAAHPGLPPGWEPRASTLAGWHTILDRLEAAVDGAPAGWSPDVWNELNESYRAELGV